MTQRVGLFGSCCVQLYSKDLLLDTTCQQSYVEGVAAPGR
jgi:hypothetical protein